jgi:flagellar export protein FliJ
MSKDSLTRLIELKQQQIDRLSAEVAGKEALRQRYRNNLERLGAIAADSGASGIASPALALNCAQYKHNVINLIASHQQELELHEADLAVAQHALNQAALKQKALEHTQAQQQQRLQRAANAREQKRQDELATQVWYRGRT